MDKVTGSLNLNQTPPPGRPNDKAVPLLGGNMEPEEVKANFNALLYLVTEVMAVQMRTLDLLIEKEIVTGDEVNEKVLAVTGDQEELSLVYNELFTRFVGYYSALRQLMADGKVFKEGEGADG